MFATKTTHIKRITNPEIYRIKSVISPFYNGNEEKSCFCPCVYKLACFLKDDQHQQSRFIAHEINALASYVSLIVP